MARPRLKSSAATLSPSVNSRCYFSGPGMPISPSLPISSSTSAATMSRICRCSWLGLKSVLCAIVEFERHRPDDRMQSCDRTCKRFQILLYPQLALYCRLGHLRPDCPCRSTGQSFRGSINIRKVSKYKIYSKFRSSTIRPTHARLDTRSETLFGNKPDKKLFGAYLAPHHLKDS
jgi:hypothetical protein